MSETKLLPYPPPPEAGHIVAAISRLARLLAFPRDAENRIPMVPQNAPPSTDVVLLIPPEMVRGYLRRQVEALAEIGYFLPTLEQELAEAEVKASPGNQPPAHNGDISEP